MAINKADAMAMDSLHGQLAKVLTEALKGSVDPETGAQLAAPAAILSVARQFLKDNGIDSTAKAGSPIHELANLPQFDDDNVVPLYGAQR